MKPETLMEAVRYFADLEICDAYMRRIKWPRGRVVCPHCGRGAKNKESCTLSGHGIMMGGFPWIVVTCSGCHKIITVQPMPMVPYGQPSGPMLGLGGPMIPGNVGGLTPQAPACIEYDVGACLLYQAGTTTQILVGTGSGACSNSLDFTQACNSQYAGIF